MTELHSVPAEGPSSAEVDRRRLADALAEASRSPTVYRSRMMPADRREAAAILERVLPLTEHEGAAPAVTPKAVTHLAQYLAAVRHDERMRMMVFLTREEIQAELAELTVDPDLESASRDAQLAADAGGREDFPAAPGGPTTPEETAWADEVLEHTADPRETSHKAKVDPAIPAVSDELPANTRLERLFRAKADRLARARKVLQAVDAETARPVERVRNVLAQVGLDPQSQDLWLTAQNSHLGGATPLEAIDEGLLHEVEFAARRERPA